MVEIYVIETSISNDMARAVLWDFAETNTLRIIFKTGTEKPWSLPMQGSRHASSSFVECTRLVAEQAGVDSPFGGSTSSPVGPQASSPIPAGNVTDRSTIAITRAAGADFASQETRSGREHLVLMPSAISLRRFVEYVSRRAEYIFERSGQLLPMYYASTATVRTN
jgi:hypothetical protein